MNTVRILDHYRRSIYDDALATTLLALIIRDDQTAESELSKELNEAQSSIAKTLDELYRANYIQHGTHDTWRMTDFGVHAASSLGLVRFVTLSQIGKFKIPERRLRFVSEFVNCSPDRDLEIARLRMITSILKMGDDIRSDRERTKFSQRALYSACLSFDSRFPSFENEVSARARISETLRSAGDGPSENSIDDELAHCRIAIRDIKFSNKLLLSGIQETTETHLRRITALRVLNAAASGEPDSWLKSIASATTMPLMVASFEPLSKLILTTPSLQSLARKISLHIPLNHDIEDISSLFSWANGPARSQLLIWGLSGRNRTSDSHRALTSNLGALRASRVHDLADQLLQVLPETDMTQIDLSIESLAKAIGQLKKVGSKTLKKHTPRARERGDASQEAPSK